MSLDWPVEQRSLAVVYLDNARKSLPPQILVEYPLPPGPHELVIEREGYETLRHKFSLQPGEICQYAPKWRWLESGPAEAAPGRKPEPQTPTPGHARDAPGKSPEGKPGDRPAAKPAAPKPGKPEAPKPSQPPPAPKAKDADRPGLFVDLPEAVDLPGLVQGDKGPGDPFAMGTIRSLPADVWQLEIRGGERALRSTEQLTRKFVLVQTANDAPKASWTVQLDLAPRDGPARQTDVSRIWRDRDQLMFQWLAGVDVNAANRLRNCLLRVTVAQKDRYLALVKPERVEPLDVDLQRPVARSVLSVKYGPDPEKLLVEVLKVEGRGGCKLDPAGPANACTLSFSRKGASGQDVDEVQFRISVRQVEPLACRLDLIRPTVEDFKRFIPPKRTALLGRKQPPPDAGRKESLRKQLEDGRISHREAKNEPDRARIAQSLDELERQLWYLEFCEAVHKKAKIHFRVLFKVEDHTVVLATTELPPGQGPK